MPEPGIRKPKAEYIIGKSMKTSFSAAGPGDYRIGVKLRDIYAGVKAGWIRNGKEKVTLANRNHL